jgi:hypothetical protein
VCIGTALTSINDGRYCNRYNASTHAPIMPQER